MVVSQARIKSRALALMRENAGLSPVDAIDRATVEETVYVEDMERKRSISKVLYQRAVEAGMVVPAPDALIDAIQADYTALIYRRKHGDKDYLMRSYYAMRLARAWHKESFKHGLCTMENVKVNELLALYNIA